MALDAASNGNFNTRYPADATALIENLVCSNSTKNADFERKKIVGAVSGNQMAEVNAKLDSVHNLLTGKKHDYTRPLILPSCLHNSNTAIIRSVRSVKIPDHQA